LWLALHLPQLSLEAYGATLPATLRAQPLVLVAGHRVGAVDSTAAERGIRPGSKRATALALAPDLLIGQADPLRDAAALEAVAHAALAFTPTVTLEDRDTVLLEVRSCLRYFGGLPALLARLRRALAPLGHRLQIAAAPTPRAAALLALWRGGPVEGEHLERPAALELLLGAVPVELLAAGREHREALQGMGIGTLAELRRLPRAGLARRFGERLLDELDRAYGRRADPRPCIVAPPVFASRIELACSAETAEQVLAAAMLLLARLLAWAGARQARIGGFTLRLLHEPQRHAQALPATELVLELAQPTLALEHLQLLLRERLARCVPAAPTLELAIECRRLEPGARPERELFPTRQSRTEGLTQLLERLRARLGDAQVQRVVPLSDHRPDRAQRCEPALGALPAAVTPRPSGLPLHRPAWLLPAALPLAERAQLPLLDGRPLQLLVGPERIESGWWDDAPVVRDYFIAQAAEGALVWIYRARLPQAGVQWFLQGRFG
jgi:protein ImuB